MKIALLTEYKKIGGGESNLLNLAEELKKYANVTLFCEGDVKKEAERRGIKVKNFNINKRWYKGILLPHYNKILINDLNKFNIVHSYSINPISLFPFINSKKILTIHGFWEKPYGLRGKIIELLTDKVITVSTDVYNITSLKNKEKIFLGTKIVNCEKTFLRNDKIIISCIGRFQRIKGQDILLKSINFVLKKINKPIEINFIGDVNSYNKIDIEFKNQIITLAKNIENSRLKINFLGFQSNVKQFINQSHLVVVPSRYESFSMVTIESLACETPVIAPNIGGLKDIINSNEIGLLFEPENIKDLEEKIIFAIKNYEFFNREKMKERSLDFSIEIQAKKHLELYKGLLK